MGRTVAFRGELGGQEGGGAGGSAVREAGLGGGKSLQIKYVLEKV